MAHFKITRRMLVCLNSLPGIVVAIYLRGACYHWQVVKQGECLLVLSNR